MKQLIGRLKETCTSLIIGGLGRTSMRFFHTITCFETSCSRDFNFQFLIHSLKSSDNNYETKQNVNIYTVKQGYKQKYTCRDLARGHFTLNNMTCIHCIICKNHTRLINNLFKTLNFLNPISQFQKRCGLANLRLIDPLIE